MRLCIPEISGRRGAGLGNELFPWAKAFLAGQALGARVLAPAWGLNPRGYRRDFGSARLDWLGQAALRAALPVVRFDEAAYRATGVTDYQDAVALFAQTHATLREARHAVFAASGMWGGFEAIRAARLFILAELLKAGDAVANTHALLRQARPGAALVAVHIRRGDFAAPQGDVRGRFNVALPLAWYLAVCTSLRRQAGDRIDFVLVTDARPDEVRPFVDGVTPLTTFHLRRTACSDLLMMAFADALVCSVSSYSMWGAFLSDAPYVWCAAQLQDHEGYGSLWGNEAAQQAPGGATAGHLARVRDEARVGTACAGPRGVPVGWDGNVPPHVCAALMARMDARAARHDLIRYGVAPLPWA